MSALLWLATTILHSTILHSTAQAYWHRNEDVLLNSAHTIDAGQFAVGVFSPLQYGLTDSLTLVMHPVFQLILTPNIGLRWNVLKGQFSLTLAGSYLQTFLTERPTSLGGGFPGSGEIAFIGTTSLTSHIAITGFAGYALDFATVTSRNDLFQTPAAPGELPDFATQRPRDVLDTELTAHGILYGVGLNWRLSNTDLLAFQVRAVARLSDQTHEVPTVTAMWAHAWGRTRLGLGLAAGRFMFRTGEQEQITLPVYPVVDLWFRL